MQQPQRHASQTKRGLRHKDSVFLANLEIFIFRVIQRDENEYEYSEGPQGRASVTQQRQRNAYDRHQADSHAYIDEKMHEYA